MGKMPLLSLQTLDHKCGISKNLKLKKSKFDFQHKNKHTIIYIDNNKIIILCAQTFYNTYKL